MTARSCATTERKRPGRGQVPNAVDNTVRTAGGHAVAVPTEQGAHHFPDRFGAYEDAEAFSQRFFPSYNTEHRHGALGLMTPHDIHYGLAAAKRQQRAVVLRAAYAAHPERFPSGVPVPPPPPTAAWINKPTAASALAVPEGAGS